MKYERYENGALVESVAYNADELFLLSTAATMAEIERLEAQITSRRTREAILGIDNGWLANQESLIAIERAKL